MTINLAVLGAFLLGLAYVAHGEPRGRRVDALLYMALGLLAGLMVCIFSGIGG